MKKLISILTIGLVLLFSCPLLAAAPQYQHDYAISQADANTGVTMRAAINAALQALASNNQGATEPAVTYAYEWWADTTTGILKQRNAANDGWVNKMTLTGTAQESPFVGVAAGGTADAITANYSPDVTLSDFKFVAFRATAANTTTTPTFSPDGLTAHVITKQGGAALAAGDIPGALAVCLLEYNLANTRWELLNPAVSGGAGDVTGVGDCTSGACGDGSSDGGTYYRFYDGTSSYMQILAGVRMFTFSSALSNAEDFRITLGNNNNTITFSSTTGANILDMSAFDTTIKSLSVPQTAAGQVMTLLEATGGSNFRKRSVPNTLTADLELQYADALPTGNSIEVFPAPTGGVSLGVWLNMSANVYSMLQAANNAAILAAVGAMPKAQTLTQCTTIKDPLATSDYNVYITPVAIHVTATHCLLGGSTNIAGQFDIAGTSGGSPAYVDSADMTCTTTISNDVALNGTVAAGAGAVIQWRSTSVSGTPTSLIACFDYTLD